MTGHQLRDFELNLSFSEDAAVLGVHGEVDVATATTLDRILGALVDDGHPAIVLDLAELRFMDAAGLGTIAGVAARLRAGGRTLSLRAVPAMALRLLDITGVGAGLVEAVGASEPEQRPLDRSGAIAPIERSRHLGDRSSRAERDAVIDAALRLVTVLTDATVAGADGVSVSLERRGRLATVAASDERSRTVDGHQYGTGQGPCLAAAAEGLWFHSESLAEEGRWPDFVPLAVEAGMASILSSPLVVAERSIGSLNIYSSTERSFGPAQQELAALFAEQASLILSSMPSPGGVLDAADVDRDPDGAALHEPDVERGGTAPSRL